MATTPSRATGLSVECRGADRRGRAGRPRNVRSASPSFRLSNRRTKFPKVEPKGSKAADSDESDNQRRIHAIC